MSKEALKMFAFALLVFVFAFYVLGAPVSEFVSCMDRMDGDLWYCLNRL